MKSATHKEHERGFIPFLLLVIIAYLILKYSFDFDVIESVKTNGIAGTLGKLFAIIGEIWTNYVKPFVLQVIGQTKQATAVPPTPSV